MRGITLFPPEKGFPRVTAPTKLISVKKPHGNQFSKTEKYDIIEIMKNNGITEYFEEVEITKEYDGYYYSVSEAITIVILGSI